jgi:hypothetical protein
MSERIKTTLIYVFIKLYLLLYTNTNDFKEVTMVVAKSGFKIVVHGFRGISGAFPSFYGRNCSVPLFRVPKADSVKCLCRILLAPEGSKRAVRENKFN